MAKLLKPSASSIESLAWVGYDAEEMVKHYVNLLRSVARHTKRLTSRVVGAALAAVAVSMTSEQRLQFGDRLSRALSYCLARNRDKGTGIRMSTPVRSVLACLSSPQGLKRSPTSLSEPSSRAKRARVETVSVIEQPEVESISSSSMEQDPPAERGPSMVRRNLLSAFGMADDDDDMIQSSRGQQQQQQQQFRQSTCWTLLQQQLLQWPSHQQQQQQFRQSTWWTLLEQQLLQWPSHQQQQQQPQSSLASSGSTLSPSRRL